MLLSNHEIGKLLSVMLDKKDEIEEMDGIEEVVAELEDDDDDEAAAFEDDDDDDLGICISLRGVLFRMSPSSNCILYVPSALILLTLPG